MKKYKSFFLFQVFGAHYLFLVYYYFVRYIIYSVYFSDLGKGNNIRLLFNSEKLKLLCYILLNALILR